MFLFGNCGRTQKERKEKAVQECWTWQRGNRVHGEHQTPPFPPARDRLSLQTRWWKLHMWREYHQSKTYLSISN